MAIGATLLTESASTADLTSYATASITPTANRLVLLFLSVGFIGDVPPAPSSITGAGLTFTLVNEVAIVNRRTCIYRAMTASPSTGAVTIALPTTGHNCAWRIVEFAGVNTAGVNGSGAVGQSRTATGSGATKTVTLLNTPNANNAVVAAFNANTSTDVPVPGAQFVELGDDELTDALSPSSRLFTEWDASAPGTVVDATGGSGATWEMVAVEIAADGVAWFRSKFEAVSDVATSSVQMFVPGTEGGTQDGDLLIMYIAIGSVGGVGTITTPAGWNLINTVSQATGGNLRLAVFWRIANAEPASYTVNFSGAFKHSGAMLAYGGADPTLPLPVTPNDNAGSGGTGTSAVWNNQIQVHDNALMLWMVATNTNSTADPTFVPTISSGTAVGRVYNTGGANTQMYMTEEYRATIGYFASQRSVSWTGTADKLTAILQIRPFGAVKQLIDLANIFDRAIVTQASVPQPGIRSVITAASIPTGEGWGNLLSATVASVEPGIAGFVAVSGSASLMTWGEAAHGSGSLGMSSVNAPTMLVHTPNSHPAEPGDVFTAQVMAKAVSGLAQTRNFAVGLAWFDAGGNPSQGSFSQQVSEATPGAWGPVATVVGTAPSGTVGVGVFVEVYGAPGGEVHLADMLSLRHGDRAGLAWEYPQSPTHLSIFYDQFLRLETVPDNLLTYNQATVEDGTNTGFSANNCTVVATTVQKAAGTWSLQLTAAGTADMEAVTTTFATTPGEVWSARASYRSAVTGRNVRTQIRWGGAGNALLSVSTGSATDNTTGWVEATVNGAVAPASTEFVSVKTTIDAPVAGEVHYVDQISLHRGTLKAWDNPVPTQHSIKSAESFGNLLSSDQASNEIALQYGANQNAPSVVRASADNLLTLNQASVEASVADWHVYSGATSVAWSQTQALHGVSSLQINTDIGFEVKTVAIIPGVVAGSTYTAAYWSRAGVTARTMRADIWWLTPGGSFLANATGVETTNSTGSWTQHTNTQIAPPGAGSAHLVVRGVTAGAGDVQYIDQMGLFLTPNLLTLNQAGLETSADGWVSGENAPTVARSTAQFLDGAASLSITSTLAGPASASANTTNIPVIPGQAYTAQSFFRAAATGRSVLVTLNWRTAANVSISETAGTAVTDATSGWTRATVSGVAPATAAFVLVRAVILTSTVAGEVHYIDRVFLGEDRLGIVPGPAFHGRYSIALTGKVAGNMDLNMAGSHPTTKVPVVQGQTYTVTAAFQAATVARSCWVSVHTYNASGAYTGSLGAGAVTDAVGSWVQFAAVLTIPYGNIAWISPAPGITSTVAGETHYIDALGIFKGSRAATEWEMPGPGIGHKIGASSIPSLNRMGGNLLKNSNYEAALVDVGAYYTNTSNAVDTAEKFSGAQSLKVVTAGGTGNPSGVIHYAPQIAASRLRPGEQVMFSAWVKGPAGQAVWYGVRFDNFDVGGYLGEQNLSRTFSGNWELWTIPVTHAYGADARPGVQIYRGTAADSITYWIDDARLEIDDSAPVNGNFETDISGWTVAGAIVLSRDTTQQWWNAASMKAIPPATGDGHTVYVLTGLGRPGRRYVTTFMAKADLAATSSASNATSPTGWIGLQESGGAHRMITGLNTLLFSTGWQRFRLEGVAPDDVEPNLRLVLRGGTAGGAGVAVYYDDVQVHPVYDETKGTQGPTMQFSVGVSSIPSAESVPGPTKLNFAITAASIVSAESFGNMLTPNQSSVEVDTTGWRAFDANTTIASSPVMALHGSRSLELTATGAVVSTAALTQDGTTPCQSNRSYRAVASFRAGTTPRAGCQVGIAWYDGVQWLSTNLGSAVTDATGSWIEASVIVTSPPTAIRASVFAGVFTAQATGEKHYVDQIMMAPATTAVWEPPTPTIRYSVGVTSIGTGESMHHNLLTAQQASMEDGTLTGFSSFTAASTLFNAPVSTNLLSYDQQSLETSATGWSNLANATLIRSTAQAFHGTASLSVATQAANTKTEVYATPSVNVSPGARYSFALQMKAATTGRTWLQGVWWYDASDANVGFTQGNAVIDNTSSWVEGVTTVTVPLGAVKARPGITTGNAPTIGAGEVHYVDHVFFGPAENQEGSGLGDRAMGVIWEAGTGVDRGIQIASIPLQIGKAYAFTVAVNIPNALANAPQIAFYGGPSAGDMRIGASLPTITTGWQRYIYTFVAAAASCQFRMTYGSQTLAADDPPMFTDGWAVYEIPSMNMPRADAVFEAEAAGWTSNAGAPLVSVLPAGHLRLGGTDAYVSTPDDPSLDATTELDLRWFGSMDTWTSTSGVIGLIGKWTSTATAATSSYLLVNNNGTLWLYLSDGTTANNTVAPLSLAAAAPGRFGVNGLRGVRVTWRSSDGRVRWFWTEDSSGAAATWVQIGSDATGYRTGITLANTTTQLQVGGYNGTSGLAPMNVQWAEVRTVIDGAVAARFDAPAAAATQPKVPTTTTQGGKVWTINGTRWGWGFSYAGGRALSLLATATGSCSAFQGSSATRPKVQPGREYLVSGWARSSVARSVSVSGDWRNAAQGVISENPLSGGSATTSTTGWTFVWAKAIAPTGADTLTPTFNISGVAVGEVHYLDLFDVTTWESPGPHLKLSLGGVGVGISSIPSGERFGGNLLHPVHSGFEADANADGIADGWESYVGSGVKAWTADETYLGVKAQWIAGDGTTASPRLRSSGGTGPAGTVPVATGEVITVWGWFWSENGARPTIGLKGFTAAGSEQITFNSAAGVTTPGWQKVEVTNTITDPLVAGVSVLVGLDQTPSTALGVYVDAVQIERGTPTNTTVPSLYITGGAITQMIQAIAIPGLHHTFGGNLLTAAQSRVTSGGGGGNQAAVIRSTLRARTGTGMLQLQVPRTQNMLTATQASMEGGITGWTQLNFCTVGVGAVAKSGTGSLQINSTGSSPSAITSPTGITGIPCYSDTQYSATASFRSAAAVGRSGRIVLFWYDATGGLLTQSTGGSVTITTSGWVTATITANSQPTAAYCAVIPEITGAANGEVFYVDEVGLFHGATATWAGGGDTRECHAISSAGYTGMSVIPGQTYNIGCWGWQLGSGAGSQSQTRLLRIQALFYDIAGNFISTGTGPTPQVTLTTTGWTQSVGTTVAPITPSWARFAILQVMVQSTVNMLPGETFYIGDVTFEPVNKPVGFPSSVQFQAQGNTRWEIPHATENAVTGDLDLTIYAMMKDYTPTNEETYVGKYVISGNQRSWLLYTGAGGTTINFLSSTTGADLPVHTWTSGFVDGTWNWLRVTHRISDGRVQWFTRSSEPDPWVLRSTGTISSGVGLARYPATGAPIQLGAHSNGGSTPEGGIAFFELKDGIGDDARIVARFDTREWAQRWSGYGLAVGRTTPNYLPGPTLTSGAARSFEDFEGGTKGWSGNAATIKRVPVNMIDGAWALRATSTTTAAGWGPFTTTTGAARVVPGRTYTAYCHATKGAGTHSVRCVLEWRNNLGATISTSVGTTIALTATPQLYSVSAVAPPDATHALISAYTTTTGAVGDWFDLDYAGIFEGADFWRPSGSGWFWHLHMPAKNYDMEPRTGQFIHLSGVGSYLSTPDNANIRITGDIDIRIGFRTTHATSTMSLLGKWTTSSREYRFDFNNGQPQFYGNPDGTFTTEWAQVGSVMPAGWNDGTLKHLRMTLDVDNGNNQHVVTYYYSQDGVWWRLLSRHVRSGITNLYSGTSPLYLGSIGGGTGTQNVNGEIVYAEVRRGINGDVVAAFDAEMAAITGTQTPTTTPTYNGSAVWTVTGTGWQWSPPDTLGTEPNWVTYIGSADVRRSTIAPPSQTEGFLVGTVNREINATYAEFTPASSGAGTILAGERYCAIEAKRLPVPLPTNEFFATKVNWSGVSGYLNQMNSLALNSNGGSTSRWVSGGVEGVAVAGTDRFGLMSYMQAGTPGVLSGQVWFASRFMLQHGGMIDDWEPGAGTVAGPVAAGPSQISLKITASSITSAASVPSPGQMKQYIYPVSIRVQNGVRLENGAYMSAPGDNLVSAVFASFEAASGVQGLTGITQFNQCTVTYVTAADALTNLLTSNQASIETDATGWPTPQNSTAARSTAQAADGAGSLLVTPDANAPAGGMEVRTPLGLSGFPVTPGRTYACTGKVRAAVAPLSGAAIRPRLFWYNSAGTFIGQTQDPSSVNDSTSAWTQMATASGLAPDDARYVAVCVRWGGASGLVAGEGHYLDQLALWDMGFSGAVVDGVQCCKVISTGGASWGPYEHVRGSVGTVAVVTGNTQYTFSGWLTKGQGNYSITARIEWRDSSFNTVLVSTGTAVALTENPQLVFVTATSHASATNCTVTFYSTTTGVAGDYFFVDKCCLQAGSSTTFQDSYHPGLDLDVRIGFSPDLLVMPTGSLPRTLIGKYWHSQNKRGWIVQLNPDSSLLLKCSETGAAAISMGSTATLNSVGSFQHGSEIAVKATLQVVSGANRVATFYWSNNDGATWSQLGATVTQAGALSAGLFRSNAKLLIGAQDDPSSPGDLFTGEIIWAELLTSINGGRVFRFDAADIDATAGQVPATVTAS